MQWIKTGTIWEKLSRRDPPLQIDLGVLAVTLGSSSPLFGVCMLCTPGFRYGSLDVGVCYIMGNRSASL